MAADKLTSIVEELRRWARAHSAAGDPDSADSCNELANRIERELCVRTTQEHIVGCSVPYAAPEMLATGTVWCKCIGGFWPDGRHRECGAAQDGGQSVKSTLAPNPSLTEPAGPITALEMAQAVAAAELSGRLSMALRLATATGDELSAAWSYAIQESHFRGTDSDGELQAFIRELCRIANKADGIVEEGSGDEHAQQ